MRVAFCDNRWQAFLFIASICFTMFHVRDWDLFFFPVSWELLVGQYRLWNAVCEFDDFSCTALVMASLSPFLLFLVCLLACYFGVVSAAG